MKTRSAEPESRITRTPMLGVSALVIVGLIMGSALRADAMVAKRGSRASDGAAVRQITESITRAVRNLVGSDQHKPATRAYAANPARTDRAALRAAPFSTSVENRCTVRLALLNLPPPALL